MVVNSEPDSSSPANTPNSSDTEPKRGKNWLVPQIWGGAGKGRGRNSQLDKMGAIVDRFLKPFR